MKYDYTYIIKIMNIQIEYIINSKSKEIYRFESHMLGVWQYVGIMYSNRNDETDVWGDKWNDHYKKVRDEELNILANKNGYDNLNEWLDEDPHTNYNIELGKILLKYNPCCNKTLDGRPYYHGRSWSYGYDKDRPLPIMTEDQIKNAILRQTTNIEIKL